LFVVLPPRQCRLDIFLLAFFRAASDQDHQPIAIFAEVNSIARAKINPVFVNTVPNALSVGKIALLQASQSRRHLGCRLSVQAVKPVGVGTAPQTVKVFAYFDHVQW